MARWGFWVLVFMFAAGMMFDAPQVTPGGGNTAKPTTFQVPPSPLRHKTPRSRLAAISGVIPALVQNG